MIFYDLFASNNLSYIIGNTHSQRRNNCNRERASKSKVVIIIDQRSNRNIDYVIVVNIVFPIKSLNYTRELICLPINIICTIHWLK